MLTALASAGYAMTSARVDQNASGTTLVAILASDEQFQVFVALPMWLIGASVAIDRAVAPERLIRRGARRTLLVDPLQSLLAQLAVIASVVSVIWACAALATVPLGTASFLVALTAGATFAAATALLVIGFSALYWGLLVARVLTGSRHATTVIALCVWVLCTLPNVGVFVAPHPANLAQYLSPESLRSAPHLLARTVIVAALLYLLASAVSRRRDEGSSRPAFGRRRGSTTTAVGVLSALGAVGLAASGSDSDLPLASVFVGVGGSTIDYLVGVTIVLLVAIAAVSRFADDWVHRAALLRIRHRTTARWIAVVLRRSSASACTSLLAVVAAILVFGYAVTGRGVEWSIAAIGSEIGTFSRIVLAVLAFVVVMTAAVIVSGSDAAPGVVGCLIVALGVAPVLWSPWNPLLTWSAHWHGVSGGIAGLVALAFTVLSGAGLFLHIRRGYEPEVTRAHH